MAAFPFVSSFSSSRMKHVNEFLFLRLHTLATPRQMLHRQSRHDMSLEHI